MRIIVTGANRGIGRELVRQLEARGDEVIAVMRTPEAVGKARVEACDLGDEASVKALGKRLEGIALDGLVNNAGVWGGEHQQVGDFDVEEAIRTYRVNAIGPLVLSLALLANLRAGTGKRILHLTSGMGSIGDNTSGGTYAYRMAKAALNMASKSLANDLRRDKIATAVINPGWVKTDMGGRGATTTVEDSVRGILARFDELDLATSGTFLNWKGGTYPW